MADIRAFRGTFYNPQAVEDLSRVVAPPYDIIDEKRKTELLSRSPFNIVRLVMPQTKDDLEFWNSSTTLFRAWKKGEVLIADGAQCIYIYRQTFAQPGGARVSRTGILASLRCKSLSSGDILPHEKTFPRTRTERLNLLRSCKANFSQIFMVFRDAEKEVLPLLEGQTSGKAFLELDDDDGVGHQLWRMEDPQEISRMAGILGEKKLIIADGHHRYETALNYSGEDAEAAVAGHARAYVSVVLFRSEDPGLAILPVHRLLRHMPLSMDEAYERLKDYFDVKVIRHDIGERKGMYGDILKGSSRPGFVMLTREGVAHLILREGVEPSGIIKGSESERWKGLDVPLLHSLVIGEGLGLDANRLAEKGELYFTPWERTALSDLTDGKAQAAFIVKPARIDEIWDVAEGGERMPHKSSYFYPKLPSGLVIYDHETAFS